MWLFWPHVPLRVGAPAWEWIEAVPVIVGLCCAFWLLRYRMLRAIALSLAGVFCVQVWNVAFSSVESLLLDSGVFQPMRSRPPAWQAARSLLPFVWWVGCWIYISYKTVRFFGSSAVEPFCPNCGQALTPETTECPRCHKGVNIMLREVAVPVKAASP